MELPKITRETASGKTVFLRGDIDVPLSEGEITDATRLENIFPAIQELAETASAIVLSGHLGRPGGKPDSKLSARPVADWLAKKLGGEVKEETLGNFSAFRINTKLILLENLRFNPGEEANDPGFAKQLAGMGELYVNESFAESHRETASIVGIAQLLPHFAGPRLAEEIEVLTGIITAPDKPLLLIIGGAKLETKIPVIANLLPHADKVVVGGKLLSEIETNPAILPDSPKLKLLELTEDGKDNTLASIDEVRDDISLAGTIVWNGPLGLVEDFTYQVGTRRMGELVAAASGYKVLGGGDTVGFLNKLGLLSQFDWVSSGGGAMLAFLAGEKLPGVEVLLN